MRFSLAASLAAALLAVATILSIRPQPRLAEALGPVSRPQILDREGSPLRYTFADDWNFHDRRSLADFPPTLISAVLEHEDRSFYRHHGVDWRARAAGLWLNLRKQRVARGSSTITEQVVRMLYPRPRHLWSKWIEGFEAARLEKINSKQEILEFYLNQVPFTGQRRGLVQAGQAFFSRDLSVLTANEIQQLANMIKRPSRAGLKALTPKPQTEASHFVKFIEDHYGSGEHRTTLDPGLQNFASRLLDEALKVNPKHVLNNGAVLLVDHQTDEVLVWAVGRSQGQQGVAYNAGLIPRQPGSSLKPFLYTMAFERGFAPSTLIEDAPLTEAVGTGQHSYRNYSRTFYGWLPLREALANSLNTPAVRLIKVIGADLFLGRLRQAGLHSLNESHAYYGDGLALGNGEVPLVEMAEAYATLARGGVHRPLRFLSNERRSEGNRIFMAGPAAMTGAILSDPQARRLEFGRGGNMEFPVQTAVKTGTSTDFRDAWAFAYNYKFLAAVWMGNLDNAPTRELTGSAVPMLLARSLMNEALRGHQTQSLAAAPAMTGPDRLNVGGSEFRIRRPTGFSRMAVDPRVPAHAQAFTFEAEGFAPGARVEWRVDGTHLGDSQDGKWLWPLTRGRHEVEAKSGDQHSRRVFFVR